MPGTAAPEGVPPEVAPTHSDALSWLERQHSVDVGLREMVPMLHSALLAVASEQRAIESRMHTLEVGMTQDLAGAAASNNGTGEQGKVTDARVTELEQSVEALRAEAADFQLQHSDELIHWHDDVERLERRLERLESPSRAVIASVDDAPAAPEGSTLTGLELKLASTEVRLDVRIRELEDDLGRKAEKLQDLERCLTEAKPASRSEPADLRVAIAEAMSDVDSKLAQGLEDAIARTADTTAQSVAQMQRAMDAVDAELRTAVITEFSGAMRDMGGLTEQLARRIDESTKVAEAASADARAVQASVDASSQARERWGEALRQWTESSIEELKAQHLAIKGEVAKETDALSRSVAAHLERLNHGATSAGSEGIAAVAQAKILAGAQNRQMKAELGLRISALETRVEQCEQAKVAGSCCCISVHDTAVEVFENEGTLKLGVDRSGGNLEDSVTVDYTTVDQTAIAGKDFVETRGQLTFEPYVTERLITVSLIDDQQWETDATFLIKLTNPRLASADSVSTSPVIREGRAECVVTIIDDDQPEEAELEAAIVELERRIADASALGEQTAPVEEILEEVRLELEAVRSGTGPR